jgi:zinc metalloprotease ZmpB
MKMYKACLAIAATFLATTSNLFAQKINPSASLEVKLPAENEAWRMTGNIRIQERTGRPAAIYQLAYKVNTATPETQARQYLAGNKSLLGLSDADIESLRLHAVRIDAAGTVVRMRQTWKGLPVNNNAEITIHISPDNKVDYVMNSFQYGITLTDITPAISSSFARQQAINHLGNATTTADETNTLMLFRYMNTDYLIHRIRFTSDNPVGEWEAYIDAKTGNLLKMEDIAFYHRKKEKNRPLPYKRPDRVTVNGTGNVFDPDPLTTATATYGGSYVDGSDANSAVLTAQLQSVILPDITLSAGIYSLVGPYAVIQDFEAPSKGLFTQASSTFAFDRNADAFEAVNTYYHIDGMMRYLNVTLGLGIMPYQYTGGVRFDPSGLSGADNSHYLGATGRIAFGEGGVDDAEDADVIIHELGHGLHDWVTAGGLSQVNGLSEGSGDYIAASYSRFKGYWTSAQAAYHYTFSWDGHNPFWGGRTVNYAAIYPGGLTGSIHTDGQIWATAMMKIWDDIGRQRADRAFWSGLGLTNGSSNQNDAANAVYQAATSMGYTNAERLAIHSRFTAAGYTLPGFTVLPVKLILFDARKNDKQTLVLWKTATEESTQSFIIERSADAINYSSIGNVAAAGNSTVEKNYSFTDVAPVGGNNYYRLKSMNVDGSSTYSKIAVVAFTKEISLQLFPNPAHDMLTIKNVFTNATVYLYDLNGKQVLVKKLAANNSSSNGSSISLSGLPNGVYMIKLYADGKIIQGSVVKE